MAALFLYILIRGPLPATQPTAEEAEAADTVAV